MNNSRKDFASLLEMVPNVSINDINSLIENINELCDSTSYETSSLKDWIPSKNTVLEVLKLNVSVKDLYFCIENFKEFAKEKGWKITDNLNAKLITHIKIMEQSGRISFTIQE